jgi:hypothetical protein
MNSMKKKLFPILLLITLTGLFTQVGCSKKNERTSGGGAPPAPTAPIGPTATSNPVEDDDNGQTCNGDASDGYDDHPKSGLSYIPLIIHQIALGGQKPWLPGEAAFRTGDRPFLTIANQNACNPLTCKSEDLVYGAKKDANGNPLPLDPTKRSNKCYYCLKQSYQSTFLNMEFSSPIPLKQDMWKYGDNDGDIFVRLFVRGGHETNLNGYGGAFCYGREPDQKGNYVPYPDAYTKLKVDVYARVIRKITNPPCLATNSCRDEDFYVYTATRYPVRTGLEIDASKCSPILRLPLSLLSQIGADALTVEIANVRTNAPCLETNADKKTVCPFYPLNSKNCWFATLQFANNETHFFKGFVRSQIPY